MKNPRTPRHVRESTNLALALLHRRYSLRPTRVKYINRRAKPCTLSTSAMCLQNRSIYSSSSNSSNSNSISGYQPVSLANNSKYWRNRGRCPKAGRLPFNVLNSRRAQVFRLSQLTRHILKQVTPRLLLDPLCSNCNVPTPPARHHPLSLIPGRHPTMRLSPTRTKRNLCLTIIRIKF